MVKMIRLIADAITPVMRRPSMRNEHESGEKRPAHRAKGVDGVQRADACAAAFRSPVKRLASRRQRATHTNCRRQEDEEGQQNLKRPHQEVIAAAECIQRNIEQRQVAKHPQGRKPVQTDKTLLAPHTVLTANRNDRPCARTTNCRPPDRP